MILITFSVVYNFFMPQPDDDCTSKLKFLSLKLGEKVRVTDECEGNVENIFDLAKRKRLNDSILIFLGWCYGFSFDEPEKVGLFPSSYVSFSTEDICKYVE